MAAQEADVDRRRVRVDSAHIEENMKVRQLLKQSQAITGLVRDSRTILSLPGRMAKRRADDRLIRDYFAAHPVRKLQIGAGRSAHQGWLSTDIEPISESAVYLDATKPFPFDDAVFDYVYSEHMIEHISWEEGGFMLRECRRVLKPGGALRLATPDLDVLLGLYRRHGEPRGEKYVRWITETFLPGVKAAKPSFVINNAFRNWGHQFLYDAELLQMALRDAGFVDAKQCLSGVSDHSHLAGMESHGKNVDEGEMALFEDMADFETMIIEASCPA